MRRSAARIPRPRLSIRARAPRASSPLVRRVMQANTGRTTQPEACLRSAVHRLGLRFRVDARPDPKLRCEADLVFRRARVCVFVDGCYWHGCPQHFLPPRQNTAWWSEKIDDNRLRDGRRSQELANRGWRVVRVWEHDLVGTGHERIAARIATVVRKQLSRPPL
jgi:DNA mismatch endonuclease (patch repair protein)